MLSVPNRARAWPATASMRRSRSSSGLKLSWWDAWGALRVPSALG